MMSGEVRARNCDGALPFRVYESVCVGAGGMEYCAAGHPRIYSGAFARGRFC